MEELEKNFAKLHYEVEHVEKGLGGFFERTFNEQLANLSLLLDKVKKEHAEGRLHAKRRRTLERFIKLKEIEIKKK